MEKLTLEELDSLFDLQHHMRGIETAFARLGLGG